MKLQRSDQSLFDLIASQASNAPGADAILALGKPGLTWSGMVDFISSVSGKLASRSLGRGKRVALVLPNSPCAATAFLAASQVATAAPLNPGYSLSEFEFYLTDLHASAIILEKGVDTPARTAAVKLGVPLLEISIPTASPAGVFELDAGGAKTSALESACEEDIALVLHTSGTTSRPKIVPLTHANLRASARNIARSLALTPADRCLNIMPLFHVHGLMAAVVGSLTAGGSVICTGGLNPVEVMGWLQNLEPTWLTAVPTMLQAILEKASRDPAVKTKLRFIRACSSALSPDVAKKLEAVFGVPVLEAYGMTEASHQIAVNPQLPAVHKFGSVGQAYGDEVAILDGSGEVLPADNPGEISIRGANVMGGYEANPAANEAAFSSDWLRTGDLGVMDAEGYIFIRGRVKEIINRGGEKISPREVDEVLLQHPAISQAVAFALPHPTLGEEVAAAVVLHPGSSVEHGELSAFAGQQLAYFKVPRRIVVLDEIPKGPTGKIQRIGLAEKLKVQLEATEPERSSEPLAPGTATEAIVLGIWKEVLMDDQVGVLEDFLSIGGDSLKATQVLTRLNEQFALQLTIRDIFDLPTVQALSATIDRLAKK